MSLCANKHLNRQNGIKCALLSLLRNYDDCRSLQWTYWGRVTHICVNKLTIIVSDNGLAPSRRQAIIWTNAAKVLIRPLGTNFSEMLIEIHIFSSKKMHLKLSSAKCRPFWLGLDVLRQSWQSRFYLQTIITGSFGIASSKRRGRCWVSLLNVYRCVW